MSPLDYWLMISQIPALYFRAGRLADRLGGAEALWRSTVLELKNAGCSEEVAKKIVAVRGKVNAESLRNRLSKTKTTATCLECDGYPEGLKTIAAPPRILFSRGKLLSDLGTSVGIVGSRRATAYGKAMAEEIARDLAAAGVTVVSGLARGVDTAAHKGALGAVGGTLAVLGSGIDVVYPPENKALLAKIEESGWIVGEYPPGTLPKPQNFPARNRIIAGLSDALIVVEAAEKSGALITADFALEQGKDVFALPGSAKSPQSRGTHALLKQGAYLIDSAADVLEALGVNADPAPDPVAIDDDERRVLDVMGWEARHIDEIARSVGDPAETARLLLVLEINGVVRKDYGGFYLRVR